MYAQLSLTYQLQQKNKKTIVLASIRKSWAKAL